MNRPAPTADTAPWPREFTPGVHWISWCSEIRYRGEMYHSQTGGYLVVGDDRAMMIDTGRPGDWEFVECCLDLILGGRPIDLLVPTHPELPHCGNLARLCRKYPESKIIGDDRDYHLFYPEYADRITPRPRHEPIDLGGGVVVTLVDAVIRDLNTTQWAYESRSQVLFVSDGFACLHHTGPDDADTLDEGEALHNPGECATLSSELNMTPSLHQATRITEAALWWARYRPADDLLDELRALLRRYPTRYIAPAHGNVSDQIDAFLSLQGQALHAALVS